jgi:GNAT superfamily N-acetyltransferase
MQSVPLYCYFCLAPNPAQLTRIILHYRWGRRPAILRKLYTMEILPFEPAFLPQAAALFCEKLKSLRQAVTCIPTALQEPQPVIERLAYLARQHPAFAALEDGQLVGYLAAWLVDDFRRAGRKAAYCPEWGHAALPGQEQFVYRALYRLAAERWTESGCQMHAITVLADDQLAEKTWFWNGFGLAVVDAVRPARSLGISSPCPFHLTKAVARDIPVLCALDDEHWRHYTRSPIYMAPHPGWDADQAGAFLAHPQNSVWLAWDGSSPAGFIRFAAVDRDSVDILEVEGVVSITGAYIRPAYRSQGVAIHILDRALQDYASQEFTCCAVTFESFNPEAAAFWPRYFEPVCYSLFRVPEHLP